MGLVLKLSWVCLIFDILDLLLLFVVRRVLVVVVVGGFVLSIEELCLFSLLRLIKIFLGSWCVSFVGLCWINFAADQFYGCSPSSQLCSSFLSSARAIC